MKRKEGPMPNQHSIFEQGGILDQQNLDDSGQKIIYRVENLEELTGKIEKKKVFDDRRIALVGLSTFTVIRERMGVDFEQKNNKDLLDDGLVAFSAQTEIYFDSWSKRTLRGHILAMELNDNYDKDESGIPKNEKGEAANRYLYVCNLTDDKVKKNATAIMRDGIDRPDWFNIDTTFWAFQKKSIKIEVNFKDHNIIIDRPMEIRPLR